MNKVEVAAKTKSKALGIRLSPHVCYLAGLIILVSATKYHATRCLPSPSVPQRHNYNANHTAGDDDAITVEDLMYQYGSDKSRDDHGYSKMYDMIFSSSRHSVRNLTEIGIAAGQSIQAWYRYFPNAEIHGFDVQWFAESVKSNMERLRPRVQIHILDVLKVRNLSEIGLEDESMDIIIEDGPHSLATQEAFLSKLFPILRPGGHYVMEDVGYGMLQGAKQIHETPSSLRARTREILENHDAIWIDAALGHRAWDEWVRRVGGMWAANRTHHNSHCVVIRKRRKPLREPMQMNYKERAMNFEKIVTEGP